MPQIVTVLNQGGTAPTDFTLHDASHSVRVAERMVDVVPKDVFASLSSYELSLLLFSAYLHDIGMTPERKKVTLHYNYLLTGHPGELAKNDVEAFQRWLDAESTASSPHWRKMASLRWSSIMLPS